MDLNLSHGTAAPVDMILVGTRLRDPRPDKIDQIARSMSEIGLRTPITVSVFVDAGERTSYQLRAGYTRLLAARKLGWETIPIDVQDFDSEEQAELWEIDENLMRGELSPAEEAAHLSRRKELFEIMALESGTISSSLGGRGNKGFAQDTAEKTGEARQAINRKIARADALGADIRDVVGTSLDKGTELDALAKMEPEARRKMITAARHGAPVSAVRAIKSDYDVVQDQKDGLTRAWNRAGPEARDWFRLFMRESA